ncbi:conserved hypothetical protein [Pediculus humanus corporis]|uniref:VPS37 C-terminal domain-containing protein n=1 Tax=Pediculus humanus subsp. corporis TaxID=121224 RepID=E0VHP5_PEDHC|nr:uncharacterized protein Phum_PHUM214090 [Pediculus humanus corporis]EEB12931.1 conserved hypothetical protein [Pediculus humanus corporis]
MYPRRFEPNYEATLTLIRHLDNDGLKELVNNDEAVEELVNNCDQKKELEMEKELIMTKNKSVAEYNLSLAPKLESGKSKLKELYDSVQEQWEAIKEKQSQIRNSAGEVNGDTALALLQAAAAESEEKSEDIADQFYNKVIEMDEFLEQFQSERKLMHLRRVKADKMKELLAKKNGVGTVVESFKYPSVPYPIGNINMPYYPMLK